MGLRKFKAISTILLFLAFFLFLDFQANTIPFQGDEFDSVERAVLFDLALSGEFQDFRWQVYPGIDHPPLAYVLFGLALHISGDKDVRLGLDSNSFSKTRVIEQSERRSGVTGVQLYEKKVAEKFDEISTLGPIISKMRKLNVSFALGSLFFIFLIGRKVGSWFLGAVSSSLLIFHPVFYRSVLVARGDSMMLFFFIVVMFISLYLFRNSNSLSKVIVINTLMGIILGLSIAAKLNGGLALIVLWITGGVNLLFQKATGFSKPQKLLKHTLLGLMTVSMISFLVFVVFTPFTWSNPLMRSFVMLRHRLNTLKTLGRFLPDQALLSVNEKISAGYNNIFHLDSDYSLLSSLSGFWFIVFILGSMTLLLGSFKSIKSRKGLNHDFILFVWVSVMFSLVIFLNPLYLERYYLPALPGVVLAQTVAIFFFFKLITHQLTSRLGIRIQAWNK